MLFWVPVEDTIVQFKVWGFEVFAFNSAASETDIWQNYLKLSYTFLQVI